MLLHKDKVIACAPNASTQLNLSTPGRHISICAHYCVCAEVEGYWNDCLAMRKCIVISDILLLTHFVANSKSLRSNDHNWVPLCMPDFNSTGFLQVQPTCMWCRVRSTI
jgi:hypothetical protein